MARYSICHASAIRRWVFAKMNWLPSNLLAWSMALYFWGKRPKQTKRVAIFKPDGIGDFVLSSEAIRRVVNFHGAVNVSLILPGQLYDMAADLFANVEILPIVPGHANWKQKAFGLPMLRSTIQANAYDEVICLRHYRTRYEDTILRAFHAEKVILLPNQSRSATEGGPDSEIPANFRVVQATPKTGEQERKDIPREWTFHAAVLSEALKHPVSPDSLRPNWDARTMPLDVPDRFLLIAPLAGRPIRDLPLPLVEAAARKAATDGLRYVVLTGSRTQGTELRSYADALRRALPHCRIEVAHPAGLSAFMDLVAKAALVVTAESSTAHIAAALDKQALILIGGGHYGWFAPWQRSDRQVWLTNKLPCFDCNWRCSYPEPFCITQITSDQVAEALPKLAQT